MSVSIRSVLYRKGLHLSDGGWVSFNQKVVLSLSTRISFTVGLYGKCLAVCLLLLLSTEGGREKEGRKRRSRWFIRINRIKVGGGSVVVSGSRQKWKLGCCCPLRDGNWLFFLWCRWYRELFEGIDRRTGIRMSTFKCRCSYCANCHMGNINCVDSFKYMNWCGQLQ